MIDALFKHAWLLMTFRHTGKGLPSSWPMVAVVSIVACVFRGAVTDRLFVDSAIGLAFLLSVNTVMFSRKSTAAMALVFIPIVLFSQVVFVSMPIIKVDLVENVVVLWFIAASFAVNWRMRNS